jgi:two-component system, NarL family, invasion response regulator UvrY
MIKILIVDDHSLFREGLRLIISNENDMSVICEASNSKEVFEKLNEYEIDLLILDISLPKIGGLEILEKVKQKYPKLTVLMLSAFSEDLYAERALKLGASGFVNKDSASLELVKAVRKVYSGGIYISPGFAEKLALDMKNGFPKSPEDFLSKREFQIMQMIGSGKAVKEISEILDLSVKTISTYRTRILNKMKFKNNSEIIIFCIKEGYSE